MRSKKGVQGGMWMVLVMAIVAIAIGGIILMINSGALGQGNKDIKNIGSCESREGKCKPTCSADETGFYKSLGCPQDDKANKDNLYCCIP